MTSKPTYHFRRVTLADNDLLARWQGSAHVAPWWDQDRQYDAEELADPKVARWIVSCGGRDFGFMQDYTVHGWDDHPFASLPAGARGIDQYIGEASMLGHGHGSGFIGARLRALFAAGAPAVGTDPHPDNHRAIAVYRRLGFEPWPPPRETPWGRVLPMVIWRAG